MDKMGFSRAWPNSAAPLQGVMEADSKYKRSSWYYKILKKKKVNGNIVAETAAANVFH